MTESAPGIAPQDAEPAPDLEPTRAGEPGRALEPARTVQPARTLEPAPDAHSPMGLPRAVDVLVAGGGPAGAAVAARLARAGHAVLLLERSAAWRWRAGGVFASPAAVAELRALGLPAAVLDAVARPIPAMRVETPAGTAFELTYGAEAGGGTAVGFDRSALDPALLDHARSAGADVRTGVAVRGVELADHRQGTYVTADGPDGLAGGWPREGRSCSVRAATGSESASRPRPLSGDREKDGDRDEQGQDQPATSGTAWLGDEAGLSGLTRVHRTPKAGTATGEHDRGPDGCLLHR